MSLYFQFSLQKVLELRERLEKQAAAELGHLQSLEDRATQTLIMQQKERQDQLAAWRARNDGELDVRELEAYRLWLQFLDQAITQQEEVVEDLKVSVRRQTEKYLGARRKREILEKLREKEYIKFYQEALGKEQQELDDIAATRFVREAPAS